MEKYRMVQGIGLYWNRRWKFRKDIHIMKENTEN